MVTRVSAARGFTLVEMLLAVTLMAMLLGLAYGGLRAATRATERGQAVLEDVGSIRITHQFIRRQINQMLPLPFGITEEAEPVRIVFAGDSRRIQFVAPMPGYLGQGGPQVQVLEFVGGPEGDVLQFSHALLQEFEPEHLLERDPIVLLEGLEDGRFEFLGRDEEGQVAGWAGVWDTPGELPVAVMLDVDLGEDSVMTWPLLTTGVKVDEASVSMTGGSERNYESVIRDMIQKRGVER